MFVGLENQPLRNTNTTTKMHIFFTCLLIASMQFTCGFQLSMVASRAPFGRRQIHSRGTTIDNNSRAKTLKRKIPFPSTRSNNRSSSSITSTLISQLACMALKRRLEDHTHVSCDLTADSNHLFLGRVGPVTVKGRGWESPLGLTCKAIEATVYECKLDIGKVISNQKLVLTTPAEGLAMVALSAVDFGNFITHPLMKPPSPPMNTNNNNNIIVGNSRLTFLKENVSVNPSLGTVTFYGKYAGSKWKFKLQRAAGSGQKTKIQATLAEFGEDGEVTQINYEGMENALALSTSQFFNELVLELDGTLLSFEDMMLTDKGEDSSVMLSLRIKVKKFPSPGIEF